MHVIFEGPDGGGKTRLMTHIVDKFGLQPAKRASTSVGGPIKNVSGWVEDVRNNIFEQPRHRMPYAFDRHAIISEPIYSAALSRPTHEMFMHPWWVTSHRQGIYDNALVVFCLPEFEVISANMGNDIKQMPGVAANIHDIYIRYIHCWQNWGGPAIRYDYTTNDLQSFTQMIGKWVYL